MNNKLKDILKKFTDNNPHVEIQEDEGIKILKPWGYENLILSFDENQLEEVGILGSISLNPKFDAIFHKTKNLVEFIFAYLDPEEDDAKAYMDRRFKISFEGKEFECYFAKPTNELYQLAKFVKRMLSDDSKPTNQIIPFRDSQRIGSLPKMAKLYFERRSVPRSFFVNYLEDDFESIDLGNLFKHINFVMRYYDKRSPIIEIRNDEKKDKKPNIMPKRFIEQRFPSDLVIGRIDEIILTLLEVAQSSSPRIAFLYFYQIFEYAGYYYTDEKTKRQLRKILKDPAVINCDESRISELFNIFSDLNYGEDKKMRKVLEECCCPEVIWREVENDKGFFSKSIDFDGGFNLNPLISEDTKESSWRAMWMPKLFDKLTKVRNALVHVRERRENKIILPTEKNNELIKRYIPVIERCTQQIAINMSN